MNSRTNDNKHNYQLNLKTKTKQTTRTGTESQKWRSQGRLSEERGRGETRDKGTGKQYKWQVQNRQGDVMNSIRNGEAKELIYMIHGHELRAGGNDGGSGVCLLYTSDAADDWLVV